MNVSKYRYDVVVMFYVSEMEGERLGLKNLSSFHWQSHVLNFPINEIWFLLVKKKANLDKLAKTLTMSFHRQVLDKKTCNGV
ncbi:hypothetical protein HanPSC8_Chr16g0708691 [Helianthus annuus]|nr:hypothetical protein HanPSC8_Chr16g0708691 [Helianthus annuus]